MAWAESRFREAQNHISQLHSSFWQNGVEKVKLSERANDSMVFSRVWVDARAEMSYSNSGEVNSEKRVGYPP